MSEVVMNPEIKERWISELRSDRWVQIQGQLGDATNGRCCLGVLCDIAVEDNVISPPTFQNGKRFYDSSDCDLPSSVMRWAGLTSSAGFEWNETEEKCECGCDGAPEVTLIDLNDTRGMSFNEIADFIEERL